MRSRPNSYLVPVTFLGMAIFLLEGCFICWAENNGRFSGPLQQLWWITVLLLLVLLFLSAYLTIRASRRRAILENLVAQKTAQLTESENNFRTFFESMTDIMLVATLEGEIIFTNQAARDKLGYSDAELASMHVLEWHPENRRPEAEVIFQAIINGERATCDIPIITRNGFLIPVETRAWRGKWSGQKCIFAICKDRSAEEEARQRFERLFRCNPSPMALSSLSDRRFLDVNNAFLETTGYNYDEIIGKTSFELGLLEPAKQLEVATERLQSEGALANFELRVRRKDGSLRHGLFSGEIVRIQDRQYFLTVMLDITVRKQMEQRNALIGHMLDIAPAAITVHDTHGRFLFANQSAIRMHGYKNEEALFATTVFEMDTPENRSLFPQRIRQITAKGEASFEVTHYHRDGSTFPLAILAKSIEWDGQPAILSIGTDITERKQAEAERMRLMSAVEQASEIFVITDPRANIEYVNPAFEKVTGYRREAVLGQNPRILKSGEQDDAFYRNMWDTLTSGKTWRGRMVNRCRDGTHYTEEATISPVRNSAGETIHYVAVKRDITEHLRMSEMLQQAQKMESVGRLAGGVAHDFNNMLGVILGHAELALKQLEQSEASEPLRVRFSEIYKAAERSANLTRQLLAFARKQAVTPEILDLNETVTTMIKMLQRLIGENIDLLWRPAENIDAVLIDPSQVDQILANLCVNARDAIAGTGRVIIETDMAVLNETRCREYTEAVPGRYVMLTVSDNGCGMDREMQKNIFEPFYTSKEAGKGTGLGLATVYGIVKQNEGFIAVHSKPGQGSTFRVYLPSCAARSAQAQEQQEFSPPAGGNETVLLVEDEPLVLEMTAIMLDQCGYKVIHAATPGEAIRLAREYAGDIHLLLTDVVMPEMNGRELARKLLASYPHLKCLFMSGYAANVITHQKLLDQDLHFIQKPFTIGDLQKKVRRTLESPQNHIHDG